MLGQTFGPGHNQFPVAVLIRKIHLVFANPAPLVDMGQFVSERGKIIKYRSCLLPFGTQGVVTHIVVGLSWREF